MSQENVELNRRVIDAFNRRDLGAYLALTDPDVFPDLRGEVNEIRDLGSKTLASGRILGEGAGSGAAIERSMWLVAEWRNEKLVRWCSFETEAEALEAAGPSE